MTRNWIGMGSVMLLAAMFGFWGGRFSGRIQPDRGTEVDSVGLSQSAVPQSFPGLPVNSESEPITIEEQTPETDPGRSGLDAVEETFNWRNVTRLQESIRSMYRDDPEKARRLVLDLKPQGIFLEGFKELGRLEAGDPEEAIRLSESIENRDALDSYHFGLLSGLATSDPGYAMEVFLRNREIFARVGSLDSIVSQATLSGNSRMALLAIRQHIPHEEHPRYFYQVYSQWGSVNRSEALKDLERRGGSRALSVGATGLFDRWARMDREHFESWLSANQSSRFFPQANRAFQKIYGE